MNFELHRFFFAIILFAVSITAIAGEKLAPANKIRTVWSLSLQPCNGGGGNAYTHHPQATEAVISKRLDLPEIGYSFSIPQLPDVEQTVVKVRLNATDRGIKDHYILLSDQDLKEPFGAVVITELPSKEKAFEAAIFVETSLAKKVNYKPVLTSITGPYGEALELLVPNRVGTHCYPTSAYTLVPPGSDLRTISISRFVLIGKSLVEFALALNIQKDMSEDMAETYARKVMDGYWLSLEAM
jgi:hypothetical protein